MKRKETLELPDGNRLRRFSRRVARASVFLALLLGLPAASMAMTNIVAFVKIGDPGNPPDARTGGTNGSVPYKYYMSEFPIQNDQWVEFLDNVVVGTNSSDPYGLSIGHDQARGGYTRTTVGTNYVFGLVPNYANKPVNNIRFDDACRFCNWLHNGGTNGGDTEYGAYDMSLSPNQVRLPGARYFLPTHDEWFKAAFYQPGVLTPTGNSNYWLYATRSDTLPGGGYADSVGDITNGPNDVANWDDPNTGPFTWGGESYNVSTVGSAGSNSVTHYGAYDMNGNVYQWMETMNPAGNKRSYAGGSAFSAAGELPATLNLSEPVTGGPPCGWWDYPETQAPSLGFRIVRAAAPDLVFVTIGNPGNVGDARTGGTNGAVAYTYRMAEFLVRCDQWVEYLNDVASADTNGYVPGSDMDDYWTTGSSARNCGVLRLGVPGAFTYYCKADYTNKPVTWVNFFMAARYVNYLCNGAKPGADTEHGAYDLSLYYNVVRNPSAPYFLPTQSELYKAAYYQPGIMSVGTNANYWLFGTASDTHPGGAIANADGSVSNAPGNLGNWSDPNTGPFTWDGTPENVSSVGGCGVGSSSHYGVYDIFGNGYEWSETRKSPSSILRGYNGGASAFSDLSVYGGGVEGESTLNVTSPNDGPPGGWWDYPDGPEAPSAVIRVGALAPAVTPPVLSISQSGNQVILSWSESGFRLQENSALNNPAGWSSVSGGTNSPTSVTITTGPVFFRLISP
jgi:formylglycine-generating enzyme required for sulfatase activity